MQSWWILIVIIIIVLIVLGCILWWRYQCYYIAPISYDGFTGYTDRPDSYDLFDTLGCRRFGSDKANFELIGKKHNLPNFARDRHGTSGKKLHDIYDKLSRKGYNKSLMLDEIELELSNIVPIQYHINCVQEGDTIISDTWYDEETIKLILKKLGVPDDIKLYATPDGKHKKWIWPQVRDHITHHLGDNSKADGAAEKYGIKATIHTMHLMTTIELYVHKYYPLLSYCMRESRLTNPYHPGTDDYYLWLGQSQYNFPIMLLFCQYLHRWCQANGITKVCGMLRDACLFNRLFDKLYHDKYDLRLIYISRKAMKRPTHHTLEYFKEQASPADKTVWIDGHGTGATFVDFCAKRGIDMPYNMNVFRYWAAQRKGPNYKRRMGDKFYRWLTTFEGRDDLIHHPKLVQMLDNFWGDMIEMFNCDTKGSFLNFNDNGEPQLKKIEYPVHVAEVGHDAFDKICNMYMEHYHTIDDTNLDNDRMKDLVHTIHLNAEDQDCFWELRRKYHDYT